jgi:hypothetical protein
MRPRRSVSFALSNDRDERSGVDEAAGCLVQNDFSGDDHDQDGFGPVYG